MKKVCSVIFLLWAALAWTPRSSTISIRNSKRRAGKLAYWFTGFGHATQSVGQFEARINGDAYRVGFVLASRVRNYGGDLEIATGASLRRDDFEILLFEGSNPLRYLWYMLGVSMKRVKSMAGVHAVYGTRVEFLGDASQQVHLQIDGEYAGRLPATLRDRTGGAHAPDSAASYE